MCITLSEISQEKDIYRMISLMWNLRNKTDEQMGRGEKRDRETNHKRLLTTENKLRVDGGRWWEMC